MAAHTAARRQAVLLARRYHVRNVAAPPAILPRLALAAHHARHGVERLVPFVIGAAAARLFEPQYSEADADGLHIVHFTHPSTNTGCAPHQQAARYNPRRSRSTPNVTTLYGTRKM